MSDAAFVVLGRASSSNVQKVVWLLDELGQPWRRVDIGGEYGGNRETAYLRLNPHGVVPTLLDGEVVVWESNSILRYLGNRERAWAYYPTESFARSQVERWMDWQLTTLAPINSTLFKAIVRTPSAERDLEKIEAFRLRNATEFAHLDHLLDAQPFIAGESLSLADIAIGPSAFRWFNLPIERPEMPALDRWYRRLCERKPFVEHVIDIGLK